MDTKFNLSQLHRISDIHYYSDEFSFKYFDRQYAVKYVDGAYHLYCGKTLKCSCECDGDVVDFANIGTSSVRALAGLMVYIGLASSTAKITDSVNYFTRMYAHGGYSCAAEALDIYSDFVRRVLTVGDENMWSVKPISISDSAFEFEFDGIVYECTIVDGETPEDRFSELYDEIVRYNDARNFTGKLLKVVRHGKTNNKKEIGYYNMNTLSFITSLSHFGELCDFGLDMVVSVLGIINESSLSLEDERRRVVLELNVRRNDYIEYEGVIKSFFYSHVLGIEM